jgi:prophage antirepressor-like protein
MNENFNKKFGNLRTEMKDGMPYFAAADVARSLKFADQKAAVTTYCKGCKTLETLTPQGLRGFMFIPVEDFCRLVAMSKSADKMAYSAWVFESVLPEMIGAAREVEDMCKALCDKGSGGQKDDDGLTIFESGEFGKIRIVMQDNSPWFVASDVCDALDLSNPSKTVGRLDDDEKGITSSYTLGGKQDVLIVSEPGLYKLIFASRKQQAKAFERWVTHDILPSIRKHGVYATDELLADKEALNAALYDLCKERQLHEVTKQQLLEAQNEISLAKEKRKQTNAKIKESAKKTREAETLTTRKMLVALMRRVASGAFNKSYKRGANAFYKCLKLNAGIDVYARRDE